MAAWIAFGVVFAAGCVGLALLFQPESPTPETVPAPAARAAPETVGEAVESPGAEPMRAATAAAGEAAAAPAPGPETLAGVTNVRLRTGTGFADAERDAVVSALAGAGLADVPVEALPFKVATSRVGYYRPDDRAAAEALAAFIAPVLGLAAPLAVRDYGQLLEDAEAGRLDLWIGG